MANLNLNPEPATKTEDMLPRKEFFNGRNNNQSRNLVTGYIEISHWPNQSVPNNVDLTGLK